MTTETLTLTDFLLARIAEDERAATLPSDRIPSDGPHWAGCDVLMLAEHADPECTCNYAARVLAECEAKRQIVAEHPMVEAEGWPINGSACALCCADRDGAVFADDEEPCRTLRALALPYADHPDYREEWA